MTNRFRKLSFLAALVASTATVGSAQPYAVKLTMDEIAPTALPVTVKGVTFSSVNGATYNAPNGGQLTFTQDPVIEGNNTTGEIITMLIPPSVFVQFGMALSGQGTFNNAVIAQYFDAANVLISTTTATIGNPPGDAFSNGLVIGNLSRPAVKVVVTFGAGVPIAYGLDNLILGFPTALQGYISNLSAGDSYVNVTNTGFDGAALGFGPAGLLGNICANVYVFDPAQEMIACCSCLTTPDGLYSFSAQKDLTIKPLTNVAPGSVVVKIIPTAPTGSAFSTCNPAAPGGGTIGLAAWATTLHAGPAGKAFSMTENRVGPVNVGTVELAELPVECAFTLALGSGSGVCNSCKNQGLASAKQ